MLFAYLYIFIRFFTKMPNNEWFAKIENGYPALEKEYLRLEPTKMPTNKAKTVALASVRARWGG